MFQLGHIATLLYSERRRRPLSLILSYQYVKTITLCPETRQSVLQQICVWVLTVRIR